MVLIKFPDDTKKNFSDSIKGDELAKSISSSLSKSAIAISINGQLQDLDFEMWGDILIKLFVDYDLQA